MVLTVIFINNGYKVILQKDDNKVEQMWEVLPRFFSDEFNEYSDGLIFRSKVMDFSDGFGKPLYLNCSQNNLTIGNEKESYTNLTLYSADNWTRFGEAYLNYLGWENTGKGNCYTYFENYFHNLSLGLANENMETYNGKQMLIYQSGGNFPNLNYGAVKMDGVICEVMATYNALTLADEQVDFFKLALEFEYNAMLSPGIIGGFTYSGTWGSDPYEIDNCLDAYNVSYTTYDSKKYASYTDACNAFDNALSTGKSSVVSFNWAYMQKAKRIYLPIHTFAATYDSSNLSAPTETFNFGSNFTTSAYYISVYDALAIDEDHYMVGYILN